MEELQIEMEDMIEPVQGMSEHLRGYFPTISDGERALLAAHVVQASLLTECLRTLVSIDAKV